MQSYRRCGADGPSGSPAAAGRWSRDRRWRRGAARVRAPRGRGRCGRWRSCRRRRAQDARSRRGDAAPSAAGAGDRRDPSARAVKTEAGRRCVRDVQRFLNGGQRDFGGVFDLFGIVRHLDLRPHLLAGTAIATPQRRHCAQVALPVAEQLAPGRSPDARLVPFFRKHPIGSPERMKPSLLRTF